MNRFDVIQMLIDHHEYKRYLEIGCQKDATFSKVKIDTKVGIDPKEGGTLRMTSDEFFALSVTPFDIIFIDGDHRHSQVFRDVANALKNLTSRGTVVMHDCLPPSRDYERPNLCGTVWRVFAKIRERADLDAATLDEDYGVGIVRIRRNTATVPVGKRMDELSYADFVRNRKRWMRPMSASEIREFIVGTP